MAVQGSFFHFAGSDVASCVCVFAGCGIAKAPQVRSGENALVKSDLSSLLSSHAAFFLSSESEVYKSHIISTMRASSS